LDARLVVIGGEVHSRQYDLRLPTVIGRSRSTDLRLGHPLVSRQHCEVFEANGLLMVRDLGSLNGTYVGDQRIAEQATPIKPGDLLTVGPVTFRAEYLTAGERRGKSSTWDADSPTRNEQKREHNGDSHHGLGPGVDPAQFRDDDDETARSQQ
jgi:pSer/pThr/pTyr-binding forkhead associated (FHA) protein